MPRRLPGNAEGRRIRGPNGTTPGRLGLELSRSGRESDALQRYQEAFEALSAKPAREVVPELRETLLTQYCTRLVAHKQFQKVVQILTSPLARAQEGLTASLH